MLVPLVSDEMPFALAVSIVAPTSKTKVATAPGSLDSEVIV